jgi:hypothetical protein|tara:strand:+ start:225 stop:665 length:441 start_codon:yes stop_codon:yes gene_type:complete
MSAYLVDSNDFAVIAQHAFKSMRPHYYNLDSKLEIEIEDVPALAVLLAQENIKSLEHRYPSEPAGGFLSQGQTVTDFLAEVSQKARRLQGHFNPAHIKRVLGSYEYQSCEHPDYYKSDACYVVSVIKDQLLDALCEAYESNQREVA